MPVKLELFPRTVATAPATVSVIVVPRTAAPAALLNDQRFVIAPSALDTNAELKIQQRTAASDAATEEGFSMRGENALGQANVKRPNELTVSKQRRGYRRFPRISAENVLRLLALV